MSIVFLLLFNFCFFNDDDDEDTRLFPLPLRFICAWATLLLRLLPLDDDRGLPVGCRVRGEGAPGFIEEDDAEFASEKVPAL